jgi:hypothetical protein
MSSKHPTIKLMTEDDDGTTVTVKNPVSVDRIEIASESDQSSVKSLEVVKPALPTKKQSTMPVAKNIPDELQYFTNVQKHKPVAEKKMNDQESASESEYSEEIMSMSMDDDQDSASEFSAKPSRDSGARKRDLLIKLSALEKKGITLTKKLSMKSKLEDIEFEYESQKTELEAQAGVKFQEKALLAFVTGLEFLNKKFDPVGAKLDGWSESVMDSIGDYESVFRKLHEKYSKRAELPPELELLMTLVASGFMFHLTNSFFKQSGPIGNILQNNPDILKNIAGAMSGAKPPSEQQKTSNGEVPMTGPSINLSSLMNNLPNFGQTGPPLPESTKLVEEDRFSVASTERSVPISTLSKSGKKIISIS